MLKTYRVKARLRLSSSFKVKGYPGLTLKKYLLKSLRRFVCKAQLECDSCGSRDACAYVAFAAPGVKVKPFIIEPLLLSKKRKALIFDVKVFGKALAYEYQLIASILNMRMPGADVMVEQIKCYDVITGEVMKVFDMHQGYRSSPRLHRKGDLLKLYMNKAKNTLLNRQFTITLTFKTPTRIIIGDRLYFTPPLRALVSLLIDRYRALARMYDVGSEPQEDNVNEALRAIDESSTIALCNTKRITLTMRSRGEIKSISFMMGSATYSLNPPRDLKGLQLAIAMLLMGELIHVGEMASAGCGKYRVELAY